MIKRLLVKKSLLLVVAVTLLGCMQEYNVKPLPNFIDTGIEPGDTVIVTLISGEVTKFMMSEFRDGVLYGADKPIPLAEIAGLKKLAWSTPKSPCGGEKPLGCSTPLYVLALSTIHAQYSDKFYDACAQHDYCYRHGYQTYGVSRRMCDEEFLQNMQETCPEPSVGIMGGAKELFGDPTDSRKVCMSMSNDFYLAVRDHGADKFEITDSSYCEYDGAIPKQQPQGR